MAKPLEQDVPTLKEVLVKWNGNQEYGAQTVLAKKLGVRSNIVSQWVRGKWGPEGSRLKELARIFGVQVEFLVKVLKRTKEPGVATPLSRPMTIPVVGQISSQNFRVDAEERIEELLSFTFTGSKTRDCIALKVISELFEPVAHEGEYMIVEKSSILECGRIMLVQSGAGVVVGRIRSKGGENYIETVGEDSKVIALGPKNVVIGLVLAFLRKS